MEAGEVAQQGLRGDRICRLDVHAATRAIEFYATVDERKDRVIPTQPNVAAREKLRSALPNDNITGDNFFAAKLFHAQTFTDAIPAILDAALSFFMSHKIKPKLLVQIRSSSKQSSSRKTYFPS
jgi:hypothetical protein